MGLEVKAEDLKDDVIYDRYARFIALDHAQRTSHDDKAYRPLELVTMAKEYYAYLKGE